MKVKTSMLCSKCEEIRGWLAKHWEKFKIANDTFEHTFNHYDDSRHLKQSALNSCHLCTLFLNNFDPKMLPSEESRLAAREKALIQISNGRSVQINAYNKRCSECVLCPSLTIPNSTCISGETTPLKFALHFQPVQSEDLFVSLSYTHISTASLATANLAKEWIAECTKFHPRCAGPKNSRFPTRLVDVQSLSKAGKIRVIETQSISIDSGIQYVALNYCWGPTQNFKLQKSTRQALSSGVAIEILPRIMQDAIHFTQSINLDWLWVDSLCIIQDSQEDWNREVLNMRRVYDDFF